MYGYHYVPRSPAQTAIFTVEGDGSIAVQPDTVRIVVGAITEGKDLTDIQQQNASIMNAILAGLRQLGIPES
ncbi:SIMPL domain-containing protein, partial [Peribacillus tepidiphilus]|uniref:SIMPL domain-containing protein n=1 Tax=Peribacillus tepidiphilus TaxID=2652445 RepID=UPI0035B52188